MPSPTVGSVPPGKAVRNRQSSLTAAVIPFVAVRALLLVTAAFSYPLPRLRVWEHPWLFTRGWLLDVWGRWDTVWYVDIALHGYRVFAPLDTVQQNVAFYPLFPLSMRAVMAIFPASVPPRVAALAAGVLVANTAFISALALLHRHVRARFGEAAATRTVWALLGFPTAFYFSCAYTESLFLLFAIACFVLAWNERWVLAGLAGALLALCRANGVVAVVPLALLALRGARSRPWSTTARALAPILFVPAGLALWWMFQWRLTGDPFAILHAQAAWGRHSALPWTTLLDFEHFEVFDPDRIAFLLAGGAVVLALRRLSLAEAGFAAAIVMPSLFSGVLTSGGRFVVVAFPAFAAVGISARPTWPWRAVLVACLAVQVLLFSNWCRGGFVA